MKFRLQFALSLTALSILGAASIGVAALVLSSNPDQLRRWRKLIMAKTAEEIAALDTAIGNLGDVLTLEMDEVVKDLTAAQDAEGIDLQPEIDRVNAIAKKIGEFTASIQPKPPVPTADPATGQTPSSTPVTPVPAPSTVTQDLTGSPAPDSASSTDGSQG